MLYRLSYGVVSGAALYSPHTQASLHATHPQPHQPPHAPHTPQPEGMDVGLASRSLQREDPQPFHPILGNDDNNSAASDYAHSFWGGVGRRFWRRGLPKFGLMILALLALMSLFAEIVAPYSGQASSRNPLYLAGPPQTISLCRPNGVCAWPPVVYEQTSRYNVLRKTYEITTKRVPQTQQAVVHPLRFWVKGDSYLLWGLISWDRHLFGVENGFFHLFGTDRSGLDLFSRLVFATRTSLGIGLLGVLLAFVLALVLGGIAGYFGGLIDVAIQTLTDVVRMVPEIPLFMALSASFPLHWSSEQVFFGMTIVLGLIGWPSLARRLRTHILTVRNEPYVLAAITAGASSTWILRQHLIPSFIGYILVELVINVPYMILKETSLTVVGLGLTRPTMSWGVLLQEMVTVEAILLTPWYIIPLGFFTTAVLAFVVIGDGLRDATDPHHIDRTYQRGS